MPDVSSTPKTSAIGLIFALLAALAFGFLVPYSKLLLDSMAPLQLAALILLGAGVGTGCLVVVRAIIGKAPVAGGFSAADAPKLALIIVLNAAAVACLAYGIYHMFATNASLVMGFETAAATVFAWLTLRRHVCFKAGVAVAFICVASVALFWQVGDEVTFVPESLLIVVACVLRGYESGIKRSFADRDPLQLACIRSLGGGIVLLIAAFAVAGGLQGIEVPSLAGALLLGFATFGLGAYFHLRGQRELGSARSEAYFAVAPFFGLIASWALFGLVVDPLFFGALAFMALGVWLAMDDSVFHEDVYAAANNDRLRLYTDGAGVFGFDYLHRPM